MRMYQNLGLCPYDSYKYEHPWIYKDQVILRPGHTAIYGLITAKNRQKVVSREADNVVRLDVEFKTS